MKNILCIDIGGTRIKAAILWDNIDLQSLKNTKVEVIRSLGWVNSSLPQIISKQHPASILQQNSSLNQYDCVSLSMPVKVIDNGAEVIGYYVEKCGVPKDLKKAFWDVCNCEVVVKNDSVCWLSGALNYSRLCSMEIEFPCLSIALGTGVGIAFSEQMHTVSDFDLSNIDIYFLNLSNRSNQLIDQGWKIHACLGEKYFYWVKSEHKEWTYYNIQEDYTKRVIAFLKDIKAVQSIDFNNIKTIFIGGGNAEYINYAILQEKIHKHIHMFTASNLQINPDLIPLLGQIELW
ncbi:MAG: hypothetical protein ACM3TR_16755 [Caulobacteraceae bacterium]